jgi:hypothetical protein
MKSLSLPVALCALLSACSGSNPFVDNAETAATTSTPTTNPVTPIASDRTLPPGTATPQPNSGIFRSEPTSETIGNGFATNVSYDSVADEFTVDNLAFDGDNTYSRGTAVSSLGPYAVYDADTFSSDAVTSTPIGQLTHRAIYGVSASGNTQFAIIRTGSYRNFGFGGFIYQRDGTVALPTEGQARYTGTAAGQRDFDGRSGLEYTTSDVQVDIDFDDFNRSSTDSGSGVLGRLTNRRVFDIDGNDITSTVVANINSTNTASLSAIPNLIFLVGPNALDANGEITGTLDSTFVTDAGQVTMYQTGNYYAILAGDNANELVGVVVVQGTAEQASVTARETSGFILLR